MKILTDDINGSNIMMVIGIRKSNIVIGMQEYSF